MKKPDINYQSYADQDGLLIDGLTLVPPDQGAGFDDLLKLSHVTNSTFKNVRVLGGTAAAWKLGTYVATPTTPAGYIQVDVAGTLYEIPAKIH